MAKQRSRNTPIGQVPNALALRRLFAHLPRALVWRLPFLMALMLLGALAELLTIGAVLPFLAFLSDADASGGFAFLRSAFAGFGFETPGARVFAATLLFAGTAVAAGSIRLVLIWTSQRYVFRVGYEIGCAVFGHVLELPYRFHIATNSSQVIAGINKVQLVVIGVLLPLMQAAIAALLAVFLIAALIVVDPVVATVTAAVVGAAYAAINLLTRRRLRANSRTIASGLTGGVQTVQEGLGGIRDIIIDQTGDFYLRRFRALEGAMREAQANSAFIGAFPRVVVETIGMLLIATLAYVLTSGAGGLAGALPVLGALALGAQRLLPLLQQIYSGWTISLANRQSLLDVLALLDEPLPAAAGGAAEMPAPRLIEFAGVGFRYAEAAAPVLRDFSLRVPAGTRVGIVGKTGSGKSTVMDLLMGLLTPTEGEVRIDGVPLDERSRRAWQRHVAHVPQTIYLADASIAENIAFGTDRAAIDMARLCDAARMAELHDFAKSLPDGYDTQLGERGVRLSGGQRQRIGIARALYKQASVIVFDEATSALDNQTEAAVMRAIFGLREDLTVFIIAHRVTTVEGCHQIVSLENGRIDRIGSYDQIIRNPVPETPRNAG